MAIGFIEGIGSSKINPPLTAEPSDVLLGRTFSKDGKVILTGTAPTRSAQTITPGTTNQTIAAGQYLSGDQTIVGDADLVAANIKSGANIFGVLGSLIPSAFDSGEILYNGGIGDVLWSTAYDKNSPHGGGYSKIYNNVDLGIFRVLKIECRGKVGYDAGLVTTSPVSLSGKNTLSVISQNDGEGGKCRIAIHSNIPTGYESVPVAYADERAGANTDIKTVDIDISGLTGSYYIAIEVQTGGGTGTDYYWRRLHVIYAVLT